MRETLTCKVGHTWTRTRTRGRKPEYCPDHLYLKFTNEKPEEVPQPSQDPVEPDVGEVQEPDEAAELEMAYVDAAEAAHEEVQRDNLAKARQAKAEATATQAQETTDEVEEILNSHRVPIELKLKLAYCQEQLALKRDPEDIKILVKRRSDLIREARR